MCSVALRVEGAPVITPEELQRRIGGDLERFVRCSTSALLHMLASPLFFGVNIRQAQATSSTSSVTGAVTQQSTFAKEPQLKILSLLPIVDRFISTSRHEVNQDNLEEVVPYALLRTNFIHLYESQAGGSHITSTIDDEKE